MWYNIVKKKIRKRVVFMRAQTPSYVISVKLHLPKQIENRLEKSFRISNSVYNEGISFGLKRFEAMKRNPYYQEHKNSSHFC